MTAQYGVGQSVILVEYNRGGVPLRGDRKPRQRAGTVTKVGRTLVTVETHDRYRLEMRFRMESGIETGDFPRWRVCTPEQLADEARHAVIVGKLAELGVRVGPAVGYGDVKLSTAALAQILAVVAEDRRLS